MSRATVPQHWAVAKNSQNFGPVHLQTSFFDLCLEDGTPIPLFQRGDLFMNPVLLWALVGVISIVTIYFVWGRKLGKKEEAK